MENIAHYYTEQKHTLLPWILSPYGYPFEKGCPALIWSGTTINGNQKHIANILDRHPLGNADYGHHLISVEEKNANAEFIVKACNAYYSQSSEIERLTKENEELKFNCGSLSGAVVASDAEIERLREALRDTVQALDAAVIEINDNEYKEPWDKEPTLFVIRDAKKKADSALQPQK